MINKNISNKQQIYLVLLFNVLILTFANFIHPLTPQIIESRHFPASATGMFYATMSIGIFISSDFWTRVLKKMNSSYVFLIAETGYMLSQVAFAYCSTLGQALFFRLFAGVFATGWAMLVYGLIDERVELKDKTRFFGYVLLTNALGVMIGQPLSGLISDKTGSIFSSIHVLAISLGIIIVVGYFVLPRKNREQKGLVKKKRKVTLKDLTSDKIFPILIVSTLLSLALIAYSNQFPFYIKNEFHTNNLVIGLINSYSSAIGLLVNIFIVYRVERAMGPLKALKLDAFFAFFGVICLFLVYGLSTMVRMNPNSFNGDMITPILLGVLLLGVGIFLLGLGMYLPIVQKYSVEVSQIDNDRVLGFVQTSRALGMILGSLIAAVLYQAFGFSYVLLLIVVSLVLAYIVLVWYSNNKAYMNDEEKETLGNTTEDADIAESDSVGMLEESEI